MNSFFSVKGLIAVSMLVLVSIGLYIIFLIAPYFAPLGQLISYVALPFIISMIFAYLLHPFVSFLMKFGLKRLVAILIMYILFFGGLTFLFWLVTPIFILQVQGLIAQLPSIEQELYQTLAWLNHQLAFLPKGINQAIENSVGRLEQKASILMERLVQGTGGILSNFFTFLVIPFLVFYFLHDLETIQKSFLILIPKRHRKSLMKLWKDIDQSLGEYIRGQIMVSLVVGGLTLIGYSFIQLPYPLFLAILMSITNIIPYFGPIIGAAPALCIAFLTEPTLVWWVLAINLLIQAIEGNLLSPWIVGRRLQIHPIFIILVLLIGSKIGGILGLILAVPVFVVCKVVISYSVLYFRRYKQGTSIDRI